MVGLGVSPMIKITPHTTIGWIRVLLLVVLLFLCAFWLRLDRLAGYYLSDKQEVDIVFQSLPHGELVDAIEGVTQSEWSHCGLLKKVGNKWFVAEALGNVHYTPLQLWIIRGRRSKLEAYRLRNIPEGLTSKIDSGIKRMLGRPYDYHYAPDDSEIYCSELVYKVYDRELNIKVGTWQKLSALNWQPYEDFIRSLEPGKMPLDREMVTPVSITKNSNVYRVYPK